MSAFLDALHAEPWLLMDGAMGTELQRAGVPDGTSCEPWNLTHPDRVLAVHRAYVDAGARILVTNTFQANSHALAPYGLADRVSEVIHAGVGIARQAAGAGAFVLGSVGPMSRVGVENIEPIFTAMGDADAILLETWSDPASAAAIIHAAPGHIPVLLSFTFCRQGPGDTLATFKGFTPRQCAELARAMHVAALGVNCGRDLDLADYVEVLKDYRRAVTMPLFARPNAGTPRFVEMDRIYPRTPEKMADWRPALEQAGARMIGGCCGTTPAHIAAWKA